MPSPLPHACLNKPLYQYIFLPGKHFIGAKCKLLSMYPHTGVFKSETVIQIKYLKISEVFWVKSLYSVRDQWISCFFVFFFPHEIVLKVTYLWPNYRIARQVIRFILTSKNSRLVKVDTDEREKSETQISWASSPLSSNPYSNKYLLSLLDQIIICLYTVI